MTPFAIAGIQMKVTAVTSTVEIHAMVKNYGV